VIIRTAAHARAGLIGNPSDGYFGKTISVIVRNFSARVTIYESPRLEIKLSQQDHSSFDSVRQLVEDVNLNGYYGGVRLIKATIKKFSDYCERKGVELADRQFTIAYETDIPRQLGLGGSSGIITATLRGLMAFYGIDDIPKEVQPSLILSVETEELGIPAGLQDRVIQVYEGVVYMDFRRELMESEGRGDYEVIDPALLPPLFIAYRTGLSEGSEVFHTDVRHRFDEGDPEVLQAMANFADYAQQARDALLAGRPGELGPLMGRNFDQRAAIYPISPRNRRMVEIAREHGTQAKYTGSGGAVIGVIEGDGQYEQLAKAYRAEDYEICKPITQPPAASGPDVLSAGRPQQE